MTSDRSVLCPPRWGMDGWVHHWPSTASWTPEPCLNWLLDISRWKDVGHCVCLLGLPQQSTKSGWLRTVKFIVSQLEKSEIPNQAIDKALLSLWRAGECPGVLLFQLLGLRMRGIFQGRILEWVAIFRLQEIFPTQQLNLCLLHCRQILYLLSHQRIPYLDELFKKASKKWKCRSRWLHKWILPNT